MRELDQTSSHIQGPNCWNGALVAAGVLKYKRFLHPEEWLSHLNQYCIEVAEPRYGDIGRLYNENSDPESSEVHGFVFIDAETIFAKHGERVEHGYSIMSRETMMSQYGRTTLCRQKNQFTPDCYHQLKYYQCFGERVLEPLEEEFYSNLEELVFSNLTKKQYRENCDSNSFLIRLMILQKMKVNLISLQSFQNHSFLRNDVYKSIRHQLWKIQENMRNYRCTDSNGRNDRDRKQSLLNEVRNLLDFN